MKPRVWGTHVSYYLTSFFLEHMCDGIFFDNFEVHFTFIMFKILFVISLKIKWFCVYLLRLLK